MATKKKNEIVDGVEIQLLAHVATLGRRGSRHVVDAVRASGMCARGLAVEVPREAPESPAENAPADEKAPEA